MDEREAFEQFSLARKQRLGLVCEEVLGGKEKITLEIGAGHGHFLAAYAAAHPDEFCVGIDLINKRVQKGESKKRREALSNLCFIKAEAMEFLEMLPHSITLEHTFLLFPDPWPKRKHWKNRLLQTPFLDSLATRMKSGSRFYFRTDHKPYFDWGVDFLEQHSLWELRDDIEWPFEYESFFQSLMDGWFSTIAERV